MNIKNGVNTLKTYAVKALSAVANNGSRIALGLVFFLFGLHAFLELPYLNQLVAMQPKPAPGSMNFLLGLQSAGYFFILLKVIEVVCGALLLWGRYKALALVALAPVVVNIFAFHVFLEPNNFVMAAVVAVLYVHAVWVERKTLSVLLVK